MISDRTVTVLKDMKARLVPNTLVTPSAAEAKALVQAATHCRSKMTPDQVALCKKMGILD